MAASISVIASQNDFLIGKDRACLENRGNHFLKQLVKASFNEYQSADTKSDYTEAGSKRSKAFIVREIVDKVKQNGGRFLKRSMDGDQSSPWRVITAKEESNVVIGAFRNHRRNLKKAAATAGKVKQDDGRVLTHANSKDKSSPWEEPSKQEATIAGVGALEEKPQQRRNGPIRTEQPRAPDDAALAGDFLAGADQSEAIASLAITPPASQAKQSNHCESLKRAPLSRLKSTKSTLLVDHRLTVGEGRKESTLNCPMQRSLISPTQAHQLTMIYLQPVRGPTGTHHDQWQHRLFRTSSHESASLSAPPLVQVSSAESEASQTTAEGTTKPQPHTVESSGEHQANRSPSSFYHPAFQQAQNVGSPYSVTAPSTTSVVRPATAVHFAVQPNEPVTARHVSSLGHNERIVPSRFGSNRGGDWLHLSRISSPDSSVTRDDGETKPVQTINTARNRAGKNVRNCSTTKGKQVN